jgi:P-type Mg2+ transporter
VEEVFAACKFYELDGEIGNLDRSHLTTVQAEIRALNEDGFRVVAVASRVD